MGMLIQIADNIKNKSGSSSQSFAAGVMKLGAHDEIRRFDDISRSPPPPPP